MFENLQLAVVVKQGQQTRLLRVPLHQGLQNSLGESWYSQYEAFTDDVDEIEFDAGYQPEEHERFSLRDYELPRWLAGETSQTVPNLGSISQHEDLVSRIAGAVAFVQDDDGNELVLFQNFSRAHVIHPGRFLLLERGTYKTSEHPGLTLDTKLSAVFYAEGAKLLFHSFRTVNTFLPLAEFYEEASEQQIRDVLAHNLLVAADEDALATGANQWFRKRFAMLADSGVLDNYTAQEIVDHSEGYEVDIELDGDAIVFPAEKPQAKRLLQFLNEEIYRGAITETLYETNSKREAD